MSERQSSRRRASTNAATPAAGHIVGDQRLYDIELAALLDKDATAAPVAAAALARHGLVVGDVNLAGRTCCLNNAGSTVRNTETTALGIVGHIARYKAASHGERGDRLIVKTSVDTAAGLMGVIGSNGAARHGQFAAIDRSNTAPA